MRTLCFLAALGLALALSAVAVGADGTIECPEDSKSNANYKTNETLKKDINSWEPIPPPGQPPKINSPAECCEYCKKFPKCNVWVYCESPSGCNGGCQNWNETQKSADVSQRFGPNVTCVEAAPALANYPQHTCTMKYFYQKPGVPADYGNGATSAGWVSGTTYKNISMCMTKRNYDYVGNDIDFFLIDDSYQPTAESCCTWCSENPTCDAWTWRGKCPPDLLNCTSAGSYRCWRKKGGAGLCGKPAPGQNLVSGVKPRALELLPDCHGSTPVGAIIGGVIGGVVFIAAIVAGFVVFQLHRRRQLAAEGDKRSALPTSAVYPVDGSSTGQPGKRMATSPPRSSASVSFGSFSAGASTSAGSDALLRHIKSTVAHSATASTAFLAPWQLDFRDIDLECRIGGGSYGVVYKAKWHETPVAVKVLLGQHVEGSGGTGTAGKEPASCVELEQSGPVISSLRQEAKMMSTLHHPNVVQFLGMTEAPAALVSEHCARGSLLDVLRAAKDKPAEAAELTWPRRISMAHDACLGMIYLHSRTPPVVHRDLKSPNLLVTKDWTAKVADFGLSRAMQESSLSTSAGGENPRWLAPEVLQGGRATPASDVYAFGVVLWELLTWELPWGAVPNMWLIALRLQKGDRPALPAREELPGPGSGEWTGLDAYLVLMQRCWAQDPAERPSFQEVVAGLNELDPGGPLNRSLCR